MPGVLVDSIVPQVFMGGDSGMAGGAAGYNVRELVSREMEM